MRVNFVRFGLILLIVGMVMLFNFWTTPIPRSFTRGGYVEPSDALSYSQYIGPVGVGYIVVEGTMLVEGSMSEMVGLDKVEYVVPLRLVVVNPFGVVLVDVETVTPVSVPINFDVRGEYIVRATNLADEPAPLPVSLEFPRDGNVVYREADKFLVSIILTVSGVVLFCVGLSKSLILKYNPRGRVTKNG